MTQSSSKHVNTQTIKAIAKELGFTQIGITKAEFMEPEARHLEQWLNLNYQGKMDYMKNHFDLRVDPSKFFPGAQSVISLTYNYYTETKQSDHTAPKISSYAFGKDYHKVIKKKLKYFLNEIHERIGEVQGRAFVDSAPLLERDLAKRSGIGWAGKNTLLISKKHGSYFFLAELVLDLALEYDEPIDDFCGSCTKCIDACPTNAINEQGYILDARKCISYLTIELKEEIPSEFEDKMENWMFGCDICQQVCPWNRFSTVHSEEKFSPKEELMEMKKKDWEEITEEVFEKLFAGSAVKRTKFEGLKRNIKFLSS